MFVGIPYDDDDYREDNVDDERNDLRDMRDMRNGNNNDGAPLSHHNPYDLNRPSHYDVGPRYPYNNPGFNRGPPYGLYNQYNPAQQPAPLYPQLQQLQQQQQQQPQYQPQPQQSHSLAQQPQSAGAQPLDGGRVNQNNQNDAYNPYAQYPHGWNRPAFGWPKQAPSSGWSLGFPFNLFGLGSYRQGPGWGWGSNRWGLFF